MMDDLVLNSMELKFGGMCIVEIGVTGFLLIFDGGEFGCTMPFSPNKCPNIC